MRFLLRLVERKHHHRRRRHRRGRYGAIYYIHTRLPISSFASAHVLFARVPVRPRFLQDNRRQAGRKSKTGLESVVYGDRTHGP